MTIRRDWFDNMVHHVKMDSKQNCFDFELAAALADQLEAAIH